MEEFVLGRIGESEREYRKKEKEYWEQQNLIWENKRENYKKQVEKEMKDKNDILESYLDSVYKSKLIREGWNPPNDMKYYNLTEESIKNKKNEN